MFVNCYTVYLSDPIRVHICHCPQFISDVNMNMAETFTYIVVSLIVDVVYSPMYAVISNSMGSGSVAYECEGHETRLSDCMSPLSSTIAPCYYALVKCFSTTDKKSGGSNGSGGSTTSGSSAGIVAGVVVSLLAVLLVVTIIVIIILIVWLKRRAENLKPCDNNASTTSPQTSPPAVMTDTEKECNITLLRGNPSYQFTTVTAVFSGTEASNVTQLQENTSYQPITPVSAGTDARNMMPFQENPLYLSTHFPASTN